MPSSPTPARLRWLPYAVSAGLIVLLGFGLRPRPAPVETARAVTGPLRATVSEEGKTRIKQRYVVDKTVFRGVDFTPVPAPGSLALMGAGALAVAARRRK